MATDKRVLNVSGDKLEIVWDGNVWVSPAGGTQHARAEAAMREELYRYLSDCGDLPDDCNDADDLDLSEYGEMVDPAASRTISIFRDRIWAGTGKINSSNIIEDCPAVLGDDQDASDETYDAITSAIDDDDDSEVVRPDGTYTWTIE